VTQPRSRSRQQKRHAAGGDAAALAPVATRDRRAPVPAPIRYTGAAEAKLPALGVVDRHARLSFGTLDRPVRQDGTVIQILRYPVFGSYGPDPNDPAWFSHRIGGRVAVCNALAPYAAARSFARGGRR
jgi:hypothetical protein